MSERNKEFTTPETIWLQHNNGVCTTYSKKQYRLDDVEYLKATPEGRAAPDLYEALKYARRFLKPEDHDTDFVDAALAKARGEQ